MNFFQHFDEHKLLQRLMPLLNRALSLWKRGMNADEGSLMNHISGALNTQRARRCNIGIEGSYLLRTNLYELHRQGPKQTDRYGSDLAVTVTSDTSPPFVKTAFFQFKIATRNQVRIEAHQLHEAAVYPDVFERSFCLAVDRRNRTIRVETISQIKANFPDDSTTHTVATDNWLPVDPWVIGWLSCKIGPWSSATKARSIEELLESYAFSDAESVAPIWDLPRNYFPAREWLSSRFIRR